MVCGALLLPQGAAAHPQQPRQLGFFALGSVVASLDVMGSNPDGREVPVGSLIVVAQADGWTCPFFQCTPATGTRGPHFEAVLDLYLDDEPMAFFSGPIDPADIVVANDFGSAQLRISLGQWGTETIQWTATGLVALPASSWGVNYWDDTSDRHTWYASAYTVESRTATVDASPVDGHRVETLYANISRAAWGGVEVDTG